MGQNSQLRRPKNEEQLVPNSTIDDFFEINGDNEFEGIYGIKDEDELGEGTCNMFDDKELHWDFMDCEELSFHDDGKIEGEEVDEKVKDENICRFWGEEDDYGKKMSLNLSLNYQDVMDSWSNNKPLWAEDWTVSPHANNGYMGEVPVMEEDRSRREASVLRYKEKRQNRLFAKKIRYQVRKLNADKRPRFKGRFVKRES